MPTSSQEDRYDLIEDEKGTDGTPKLIVFAQQGDFKVYMFHDCRPVIPAMFKTGLLDNAHAYFSFSFYPKGNSIEEMRRQGQRLTPEQKSRITYLANSKEEHALITGFGLNAILVNNACFVRLDDLVIRLRPADKPHDAIYNARMLAFKRHELTALIDDKIFLSYGSAEVEVSQYRPREHHHNLRSREISRVVEKARVGLMLSPAEGACYASLEYLLCGMPVVSTPSRGGRDEYYTPTNSIICDPTPEAVRDATILANQRMLSGEWSPEAIRAGAIEKVAEFRATFAEHLEGIFARAGHEIDVEALMEQRLNSTKLWQHRNRRIKPDDIVALVEVERQRRAALASISAVQALTHGPRPTSEHDISAAVALFLGRGSAMKSHFRRFAGGTVADTVGAIVASEEFRQSILPAILFKSSAPRNKKANLTLDPDQVRWVYDALGLVLPPGDVAWAQKSWIGFVREILVRPDLDPLFRKADGAGAVLDAIAAIASNDDVPSWRIGLHALLMGEVPRALPTGRGAGLEGEAYALLTSDRFRNRVLRPLLDGSTLPHTTLWGPTVSWHLRSFAEAQILPTMRLGSAPYQEPWERFLLRLLSNPDALFARLIAKPARGTGGTSGAGVRTQMITRLRSSMGKFRQTGRYLAAKLTGRSTAEPAARVAAVAAAVRRARARYAALDRFVEHPLFVKSSAPSLANAFARALMLGHDPQLPPALVRRGAYDVLVRHVLASMPFQTKILPHLASGIDRDGVDEAALVQAFDHLSRHFPSVAEHADDDPVATALKLLTSPELLNIAYGGGTDNPQDAFTRDLLRSIGTLTPSGGTMPWVRLCTDPDGTPRVEADSADHVTLALRFEGEGTRVLDAVADPEVPGRWSARLVLPIGVVRPVDNALIGSFHAWATDAAGLETARAMVVVRYLLTPDDHTTLVDSHGRAVRELRRAREMLQRGLGNPVPLLATWTDTDWPSMEAIALSADLAILHGDLDGAAALLSRIRDDAGGGAEALAVAAHLAMIRGDHAEAIAQYEKIQPLPPVEALLRAAASKALGLEATLDHAWLDGITDADRDRLLDHLLGTGDDLAWLNPALAALPHEQAEQIAGYFVAALAALHPGAERLGAAIDRLSPAPLGSLGALYRHAIADSTAHRLLPALLTLPPAKFQDMSVLLALARQAQGSGDTIAALGYARAASRLDPGSYEAHELSGNFHRLLGQPEEAMAAYHAAIAIRSGERKLLERLLGLEIDAANKDPLAPRDTIDRLTELNWSLAESAVIEDPKSRDARYNLARAAVMRRDYDQANDILAVLRIEDSSDRRVLFEQLRIAQVLKRHEVSLAVATTLLETGFEPRALVGAVRALRALGRFEEAQALLLPHLAHNHPMVRREYTRGFFYVADFAEAATRAEDYLPLQPDDLELRLLAAAAYLELGEPATAGRHVEQAKVHGGDARFPLEMPLFACAVAGKSGNHDRAIEQLDPMFAARDAGPVRYDPALGAEPFDQLVGTSGGLSDALREGPLVSVIMTTFDAEAYVGTAIRSILAQSYRNIELIIVDDCSNDGTPALLQQVERDDPRVRVILKSTNDGTYVSKNMGLLQARGDYVALQDSDDWSHPDRIARSIEVLIDRPDLAGLTTDWVRMTTAGDVVIKGGGQIAHLCCISLVFRREEVMRAVGFFDSVRIAADLEFIERIKLVFGPHSVPRLKWPLLIGRARTDSLTASEEFGLSRTGFSAPRQAYHENSYVFHKAIAAGASAHIPFPLTARAFPAPAIILPERSAA